MSLQILALKEQGQLMLFFLFFLSECFLENTYLQVARKVGYAPYNDMYAFKRELSLLEPFPC